MTEVLDLDGRIRDLAELCTRHGTPCADGLLAEIGRLRGENESLGRKVAQQTARADMWKNEDRITRESLGLELERTTGDWEVAIREAAAAREALKAARSYVVDARHHTAERQEALRIVDAALDQRLTQ